MYHVQKILSVSVSAESTDPLHGTIEIETSNSRIRFELNDEVAHNLCADLEHFLTRRKPPAPAASHSRRSWAR